MKGKFNFFILGEQSYSLQTNHGQVLQSSRTRVLRAISKSRLLLLLLAILYSACKKTNDSSNTPKIPRFQSSALAYFPSTTFGPSTMFTPLPTDPTPGVLYGRAVELNYSGANNGNMYATSERYNGGTQIYPIFESTNGGVSWSQVSSLSDSTSGWQAKYEPFLYELPQAIGGMPAGTLLCAGISCPPDNSQTALRLYKSNDLGRTWTLVSTIATGGAAIADGAHDPIWEPFLMVANNKLICYYSDERDPANNQKVVHQTSTDGINWGSVVNDVALGTTLRPGMPTVAKMANGQYIMTYEIVNASGTPTNFKISADAENWNASSAGTTIANGGSPYIVALSSGKLVMNNAGSGKVYINMNNGTGSWTAVNTPMGLAYSRGLVAMANGNVFIISGGWLNTNNSITYACVNLGNWCKFINRTNGKCIDNMGITTNGSNVCQYASGGSPNQNWLIQGVGNGIVKIYGRTGTLYLDDMNRTTNGSILGQYTWGGSPNQQWTIADAGSGYVKIFNVANGLCIDNGGLTADGATMEMWANGSSTNQQWQIVPVN